MGEGEVTDMVVGMAILTDVRLHPLMVGVETITIEVMVVHHAIECQ